MNLSEIQHEIIGDCTIYKGDAMHILPALVAAGIVADCIVTDPPYLLTSGGATKGGLHERIGGGAYDNSGHLVACNIDWHEFMPKFYKVMGRGHAYVMCNNRHIANMINAAENAGFGFHNVLVWDKGNATPNRWYMKNMEFTGLFYKGKAKNINDCGSKALIKYNWDGESSHPTEKPIPLMEHYIVNSTDKGGLVIDPFMGSGTTGVACVRAGRKFIGIELTQEYFDESVRRIKQETGEFQHSLI